MCPLFILFHDCGLHRDDLSFRVYHDLDIFIKGYLFCRMSLYFHLSEIFSQLNFSNASDGNITEVVLGFSHGNYEAAHNFHSPIFDDVHFDI